MTTAQSSQSQFPPDFWLLTLATMFSGGYGIMLLSLTLMYGNDAGFPSALAGLLSSVFAFASLAVRPFSGLWCDRWSKKGLLLLSGLGFALTPSGFLLHAPYPILLTLRIAQGVCLGLATTAAGAMATALIPREGFTEGVGYYGIGMAASSALAPGIGLWLLRQFGYPGVFLFSASLGLAVILLTLPVKSTRFSKELSHREEGIWQGLFEPTALFSTAVSLILAMAQVTVMQFLSYRVAEWGGVGTGVFYPLSAVAVIGLRMGAGRLRRILSDPCILLSGLGLLIITYGGLFCLAPTNICLTVLALTYGFGHSMSSMVLNSMAIADALPERIGAANATYLTASDLGYAMGPILWNSYCAQTGYHSIFAIAALLVAAMLLIVCINLHKHYG